MTNPHTCGGEFPRRFGVLFVALHVLVKRLGQALEVVKSFFHTVKMAAEKNRSFFTFLNLFAEVQTAYEYT